VTTTAQAQDQAAQDLSTVTITGSRIQSPNLQSISPVTAITAEALSQTGKVRIEDIINQLPQAFAAQGSNIANGSDGTATVDLRNLGDRRTLVLVNGRRMMPGDPDGGSAADLNNIPLALVKRVDVLTGGASSVYGAATVRRRVNFTLDTEFRG
jgi:outer membrane cobalamin receptor